jgi:peptidoglycan/LPS O-acetylase OafA/YrhL|tara:strand:+ start:201 stop:1277 length:1077 start_codon:yes stop_codon:yes gene_type:complete
MKLEDNRFYLLDFYRAIAAFAVVLFHYRLFYSLGNNLEELEKKEPLYNIFFFAYNDGWLAVQFFFVLSGFIFFNLYLKKINNRQINFKKFFILRFSRLYPLHILTLILVFFISFLFIENNFLNNIDLKHFFLNIFLIQNWGFEDGYSFNNPAWSISVEILMYGIFFVVAKTKKFLLPTVLILIILSSVIFFKYKLIGYGGFCFFIGGLTSQIFEFIKKKFIQNSWIAFFLFFILIFLISYILHEYDFSSKEQKVILIVFFFPSLILASVIFPKKDGLIIKKISIIGNFSFSIYMIHYLVILIFIYFLKEFNIFINFNSLYFLSVYLLTCFFLSVISFYFFEMPLQNLIRKKLILKKYK